MLRINIHDKPEALTFQLEGRLAGPWVRLLQECWQDAGGRPGQRSLYVDLTGVTAIDAAGRACLSMLHRQGVEFIAADCLTKSVVDEVSRGPPSHGATHYFVDEDTRREYENQPTSAKKEIQS